MANHRLPGLDLSVTGPASAVRSLVDAMFQLCPPAPATGGMPLDCRIIDERHVGDHVPAWLAEAVAAVGSVPDPVMVAGAGRARAAFAHTATGLCCAWLNEARDRMGFVATVRQDIPPRDAATPGAAGLMPVSASCERNAALSVQSVLIPILREAFLDRGLLLLHSAAAVLPDGRGILLAADGGGGKTTTVLSILRLGARLLGDDLTVLDAREGGVRAFGLPEPMNLTAETIDFFDELRDLTNAIPGRPDSHKKTVSPCAIYGADCLAEACEVAAMYFVRIAPDGPAARPLRPGEALDRLFRAHIFARNQRIGALSFAQLSDALARVTAYELQTGPCPRSLGDWLLRNGSSPGVR